MPVRQSMTALLCAGVLSLLARPLHAEKTYPIRIETTPSGATVYLEDKDGDPLGRTPYDGKLAAGNHTLIIELEGFVGQVSEISVKKKSSSQKFKLKLAKVEKGTIEVMPAKAQAQVAGAKVFVDGREEGNLPDTIKVDAGAHQVEVKKEGYKTYEEWIEVQEGDTTRVKVELISLDGKGAPEAAASDGGNSNDDTDPSLDTGDDDGDDSDVDVEDGDQARPSGRTVPYVAFAAGVELGGRRFRFQNPQEGNLRPYDAGGVPMIRLGGELSPLAFSTSKAASGWTLTGSYAHSTPLDSTATIEPNMMSVSVPTTWSEIDLGGGYRYRFGDGDASYVGAMAGYGIHTFTFKFDGTNDALKFQIPDVKYKFISVGLDGRFAFAGRFAALLSGGTRLVSATGNIGNNFAKTDVLAFGMGAGLAAGITRTIEARMVGRFDQYKHTFTPKSDMMIVADGGTDRYFGVSLSAVFLY